VARDPSGERARDARRTVEADEEGEQRVAARERAVEVEGCDPGALVRQRGAPAAM
jgi:hypothetical protein